MGKVVVVFFAIVGMLAWITIWIWVARADWLALSKYLPAQGRLVFIRLVCNADYDYRRLFRLWHPENVVRGIAVVLIMLATFFFMWAMTANPTEEFATTFAPNLATDCLSLAVTILVIDQIYRWRDKVYQQHINESLAAERKRNVIQQMGSRSNDFAVEAARIAGNEGWLADGSLRGADLSEANLQGARLSKADLRDTNLLRADLRNARMVMAKLQGADLFGAKLQGANLLEAKLQNSNLTDAYLHDTHLEKADLTGARLCRARYSFDTKWPEGFDYRAVGAVLDHSEEELRGTLWIHTTIGWTSYGVLREEAVTGGVVLAVEIREAELLALKDYAAYTEYRYSGIPGRVIQEGKFTVFDVLYEASPIHLRYLEPDPVAYGKVLMVGLFRPPQATIPA